MNIPPDVIETMAYALCGEKCACRETGIVPTFERCVLRKDKARAALSALADSGWVVVPKEPTKEMIIAAENTMEDFEDETIGSNADGDRYSYTYKIFGWERGVYQAMLAAALPTKDTSHG